MPNKTDMIVVPSTDKIKEFYEKHNLLVDNVWDDTALIHNKLETNQYTNKLFLLNTNDFGIDTYNSNILYEHTLDNLNHAPTLVLDHKQYSNDIVLIDLFVTTDGTLLIPKLIVTNIASETISYQKNIASITMTNDALSNLSINPNWCDIYFKDSSTVTILLYNVSTNLSDASVDLFIYEYNHTTNVLTHIVTENELIFLTSTYNTLSFDAQFDKANKIICFIINTEELGSDNNLILFDVSNYNTIVYSKLSGADSDLDYLGTAGAIVQINLAYYDNSFYFIASSNLLKRIDILNSGATLDYSVTLVRNFSWPFVFDYTYPILMKVYGPTPHQLIIGKIGDKYSICHYYTDGGNTLTKIIKSIDILEIATNPDEVKLTFDDNYNLTISLYDNLISKQYHYFFKYNDIFDTIDTEYLLFNLKSGESFIKNSIFLLDGLTIKTSILQKYFNYKLYINNAIAAAQVNDILILKSNATNEISFYYDPVNQHLSQYQIEQASQGNTLIGYFYYSDNYFVKF